jgi:hypothetical protein
MSHGDWFICVLSVLTFVASALASRYLDANIGSLVNPDLRWHASVPFQADRAGGAVRVQDRVFAIMFERLCVLFVRSREIFLDE